MPPDHDHPPRLTALGHAVGSAWALLVGVGLLMLGSGLQGSLLGVRASLEGFGTTTTGVIMSSYYLGYLVGSSRAVGLVTSVGHIRVFAALASIMSSAILLHVIIVEPAGWVVLRIASGFCTAGLFIVAESWLNDLATGETRGSLLSLYMVVVSGAMGGGQLLLNVAPPESFELFVAISVLVSLALVPASLSVRAAPQLIAPVRVTMREVFHAAPLGIVGVVLVGSSTAGIFGMGVVYAQLVGFGLAKTSLFMLVAILGGALLQLPIGALSDHTDRRRVILAAAALASLVSVVTTTNPTGAVLLVAFGTIGGFSFPLYALLNAHVNDWIEPAQIVGAGSRLVLAMGTGAIVGPFAASLAMSWLGPAGFFWFLALVHAAVAVYAAWRLHRRPPRPVDEQAHFAPLPARGGSMMVSTLNPDAWDDDDPVFESGEVPVATPET